MDVSAGRALFMREHTIVGASPLTLPDASPLRYVPPR